MIFHEKNVKWALYGKIRVRQNQKIITMRPEMPIPKVKVELMNICTSDSFLRHCDSFADFSQTEGLDRKIRQF